MMSTSLHPYREADRPLLRSLELLYSHDFSELTSLSLKEGGYFLNDAQFEQYFLDVHATLIIRHAGKPAGFAIVADHSQLDGRPGVHDVLQFFVLRGLRRLGVGRAAAIALFDRFPGPWEVRQIDTNPAAQAFWRKVVAEYSAGDYQESRWQEDDDSGVVQSFIARGHPTETELT